MLFIGVQSTASIHKAHEAGASRVQFIAVRSTASKHKAHEAGALRVRCCSMLSCPEIGLHSKV